MNPGIEVLPVLEPVHTDGTPQRWISFQSKYFDGSVGYSKILDSAKKTIKYYKGKLDLIYLFSNKTNLARLLANLDSFKNIKQYQSSELLIAALRMESEYNLGMNDKAFLENAISEYDSFSYQVKNNTIIRYYLGICLELNGERDKAIDLYQKMEWKTDDTIAERYMICLILSGHADAACEAYNALSEKAKNIRTLSVYLFALSNNHDTGYSATLLAACNEYRHDMCKCITNSFYSTRCINSSKKRGFLLSM